MSCCKKAFIICEPVPSCLKQLKIRTPFNNTSLTLKVIDKFKRIYSIIKTTDTSGFFTIQVQDDDPLVADLPLALFNEFAGSFKLMIYKTASNEQWTINGEQIDAIAIIFKNITPVVDTYSIDPMTDVGTVGDFNLHFSNDFEFSI